MKLATEWRKRSSSRRAERKEGRRTDRKERRRDIPPTHHRYFILYIAYTRYFLTCANYLEEKRVFNSCSKGAVISL